LRGKKKKKKKKGMSLVELCGFERGISSSSTSLGDNTVSLIDSRNQNSFGGFSRDGTWFYICDGETLEVREKRTCRNRIVTRIQKEDFGEYGLQGQVRSLFHSFFFF